MERLYCFIRPWSSESLRRIPRIGPSGFLSSAISKTLFAKNASLAEGVTVWTFPHAATTLRACSTVTETFHSRR
jgi:hypothetical protein